MVYVLVLQASTRTPVAQAKATTDGGLSYQFSNLPPGDYLIYAGTDRDGDGYIGDAGDLCGALPSLSSPQTLSIAAGATLQNIDFLIDELPTDGSVQPLHLPLITP